MMQKTSIKSRDIAESINPDFFDPDNCRQWLLERLHPKGPSCPWCGVAIRGRAAARFWLLKQMKCQACGRKFTARTGTNLAGLKAGCRELVMFCLMLEAGYPMARIGQHMNIGLRTLYLYKERFQDLQ